MPNFLSALLSGLTIVGIGALIAWYSINQFQRRNVETLNKDKIIKEISSFKESLQNSSDAWISCKQDQKNTDLWLLARSRMMGLHTKREILNVKILNQYPDFLYKEFSYKDEKDTKKIFMLKDLVISFREYVRQISDSLAKRNYELTTFENITKSYTQVLLYLSHILIEIIKEPLKETVNKQIRSRKKNRKSN